MSDGLQLGAVLQGTYKVLRKVGAGGMGAVYEAKHLRLPGRFAIKVLLREMAANPEAYARFKREAETTSALRHPNIVQVVDFNSTPDGAPYMVMEFLEGVDLATRLQTTGPLRVGIAVEIASQVASALAAAHSRGVVHRDLKPQNVFISPVAGQDREIVKVVDFGISKVKAATKNLTRQAAVMGTPQYMSPEQALGRVAEIDDKTDQFALGAIVYEMLAGRPAFDGDSLQSILYQVTNEDPAPLASDPEVERVVRTAMSKRRQDRYPNAMAFQKALEAAATSSGVVLEGSPAAGMPAAPVVRTSPPDIANSRAPTAPRQASIPTTFTQSAAGLDGLAAANGRRFSARLRDLARAARARPRWAAGIGAAVVTAVVLIAVASGRPGRRQGDQAGSGPAGSAVVALSPPAVRAASPTPSVTATVAPILSATPVEVTSAPPAEARPSMPPGDAGTIEAPKATRPKTATAKRIASRAASSRQGIGQVRDPCAAARVLWGAGRLSGAMDLASCLAHQGRHGEADTVCSELDVSRRAVGASTDDVARCRSQAKGGR